MRSFGVLAGLAAVTQAAPACPAAMAAADADYKVSKSNVNLVDGVRSRSIPAVVWRPSDSEGPFPFVSINHGAGMAADSSTGGYGYIAEALAARGYVVAGWNEYSSKGTSVDYILDSAAIRDSMYNASGNSSHEFHGLLCDKAVGVGHSLGGGAEFVAADVEVMKTRAGQTPCVGGYSANYQGLATLSGGFKWNGTDPFAPAPAPGTPNPYESAPRLKIPALFVSGTQDCMVKPLNENYPFYTNMTQSPCRIFANVTGADHCQWADLSGLAQAACAFTEKFASGGCKTTLAATDQQAYAVKYVLPFFEAVTKGNAAAMSSLLSELDDDSQKDATIHEFNGCTSDAIMV